MKQEILKLKQINSVRDIRFQDLIKFTDFMDMLEDIDNKEEILQFKALEIFYGIKSKEARKLSPNDFKMLVNKIETAIGVKTEFKLQNIIIMKGVTYGLIPNFEKVTTGELIDLDTLLTDKKFIEIFSILYRPIIGEINKKGEYRIVEYEGFDEKFKDIDVYTANACLNFFIMSFQTLNQAFLTSMIMKGMKQKK